MAGSSWYKGKLVQVTEMGRGISALAQAAIINYHRLGGFDYTHLFITVQEARKSKIKVPANLVPGENTF